MNRPVLSAVLGALTLLIPLAPAIAEQETGAAQVEGQVEYNNACRTCHSMREGDNRLGPMAWSAARPAQWQAFSSHRR